MKNIKMILMLVIGCLLITFAATSIAKAVVKQKTTTKQEVFIDHAETVNGDELWLTMGNEDQILVELVDEVDKYYINHKGEEYMIFYVSVCEDHTDNCTHYVLVMGEYIEAPNSDI